MNKPNSKNTYYRGPDGKISSKRLSPYGKSRLTLINGSKIQFPDGTLVVKGNELVHLQTGKVVDKLNNDRSVNKVLFALI